MKTIFKILAITLLICPLLNSAMESEQTASDVEIYQLLLLAAESNPELNLLTDIVSMIALTAHHITEEENRAIAYEIDRTHALKKQIAEQNQKLQNLMHEARTLMQETKDINEENSYLESLIKAQNYRINETSCLTQ